MWEQRLAHSWRSSCRITLLLVSLIHLPLAHAASTDTASACPDGASAACFYAFEPAAPGGRVHYYASRPPGAPDSGPTRALIAMHGHSRDANKTFDAALKTVTQAGTLADTLVIAPLFQVATTHSAKCRTAGVPGAEPGDLLWRCGSWMQGDAAEEDAKATSLAVLDALVVEVKRRWPGVRTITLAGFSAGGQMIQHYIGFAATPPPGVSLRYVVADPGTWLYFDPERAQPQRPQGAADWSDCSAGSEALEGCTLVLQLPASCADANRWKYGLVAMPQALPRDAAAARAVYAAADIHYLEGALDNDSARGTAYSVLDKSCAAMAQGPFRLQRGLAYAFYDRTLLAPSAPHALTVVPGCAHDVACVFPSPQARAALTGPAR